MFKILWVSKCENVRGFTAIWLLRPRPCGPGAMASAPNIFGLSSRIRFSRPRPPPIIYISFLLFWINKYVQPGPPPSDICLLSPAVTINNIANNSNINGVELVTYLWT